MIANFFQSLSDRGVDYLLISGQATVLYGAATFSEDIDLWINPTSENRDRCIASSKLALAWFDQPECPQTPGDLHWALQNIFTLPELRIFFSEHPKAVDLSAADLSSAIGELGRQWVSTQDVTESAERQVSEWMQRRLGANDDQFPLRLGRGEGQGEVSKLSLRASAPLWPPLETRNQKPET